MRILDHSDTIRRIDRSDMLGRIAQLPQQCREGWQQGLAWRLPNRFKSLKQLLILGMGGSAIGADLLDGMVRSQISRPILVNRTYALPHWVGPQTLVLVCSYSGNTEETLSAARAAKERGASLLAIASGGKLVSWSRTHRIPLARIPQGLPPRSALGYMVFIPLGLVVQLGWVERRKFPVAQLFSSLERFIRQKLAPSVATRSNPAKQAALKLKGRLPVLYGASEGWEGITYRWRTQLEENSKTLAFHHLFPEATHNEVSGWVHPRELMGRLTGVFLTDPAIHPRIRRRMEFTKRVISGQGAQVLTLGVPGGSRLIRGLRLIALGDFISVYLGILYRVDPTPVERVEALKKFMKKG